MYLLEIEHVTKNFGREVRANDDISLTINRGEVYGLLGPNGAGKTTLVSQVIALAVPTSGAIRIDGVDVLVGSPRFLSDKGVPLEAVARELKRLSEASGTILVLARAKELAGIFSVSDPVKDDSKDAIAKL